MTTTEYESNIIKQKNRIIYALIAAILIILVIKIKGLDSFASVLMVFFGGLYIYTLTKQSSNHATTIMKRIREQYRKDLGIWLDVEDWTCAKMANEIYFWFPYATDEGGLGFEFDIIKGEITGKLYLNVAKWMRMKNTNSILKEVAAEGIKKEQKDIAMEKLGYSKSE